MIEYNQLEPSDTKASLHCSYSKCKAKIISLDLNDVKYSITDGPLMLKPQPDSVDSNQFFKINDVWSFDNIAVSRLHADLSLPTIDSLPFKIERLLICSECDRGPIGFAGHENDDTHVNNLVYYLSTSSVLYNVKPKISAENDDKTTTAN